jgi:hypothetical protein
MNLPMCLLEGDGLSLRAESGGWLPAQRPEPALAGQTPMELLARTAQLPGNLRYGSVNGAEVVLLSELRGMGTGVPAEEPLQGELDERMEAALEASGFAWKRRAGAWVVPANERLPREIQITAGADVLRIEAVLIGWEGIGDLEALALCRLLCRAQFGLRFARCELEECQVRIASLVEMARLERDLPDGLAGVAAGSRLLVREVGVLLTPEMAQTYLAFLSRAG